MERNEAHIPFGIRGKKIYDQSEPDVRVRRFLTPQRIVWKSEGPQCSVTGESCLLVPHEKQIHFNIKDKCVLSSREENAGLLLDFGTEFHGYIKLFIHSVTPASVRLRIRFGESVMEAMSELGGTKNATNDHINRDQIITAGFLSMPEIGPSGFRFARIDLIDPNTTVELMAVQGIFVYRDLAYKGSFRCDDERLNTIWNTGAYTVHLNMQEYIWDGIKRDRLVWIGDMHPEVSTIQAVFGYDRSVEKSLDLARDESPLPAMMCGISSYSLWWILLQHSWYMQNGSLQYLQEQKEYLCTLLAFLSQQIDESGSETLPANRFLDWPSNDNPEAIHAGLQAILCMAMKSGAFLCRELNVPQTAALCEKAVQKLMRHIPDPNQNKQAAALLALSGIADPGEMNDTVMKIDGARRISTFMGYYVLQARALAGDIQGALDTIREYWGAMLDRGATTFWEDFNLDWLDGAGRIDELVPEGMKDLHGDYGAYCYIGFRHSLCHGWASGPTAFLSQYVLGVKPTAPGCRKVKIKPALGNLNWAEGTYPTPYGLIKIRHSKTSDGKIVSSIDAPEEVEIEME